MDPLVMLYPETTRPGGFGYPASLTYHPRTSPCHFFRPGMDYGSIDSSMHGPWKHALTTLKGR